MSVLYAWLRRHPLLVDGVLAAVLMLAGIAQIIRRPWPVLPVMLIMVVPVAFRRWPRIARGASRRPGWQSA